jgi:hypothetical protein
MTIVLIYLHITYVEDLEGRVLGTVRDKTIDRQLPLVLHVSLPDSHQIRLTRTGEHQHDEISPMGRLTSSADESGMFDLPP